MKVGGEAGSKFWGKNFFDIMKVEAMKKLEESGKAGNVYALSAEERQKWIDVGAKPVWDKWVASMEKQGVTNAKKILETTLELGK